MVILIFACFRRHISSSESPVSLQASLLCLVEHPVNLVTCQNEASGANPLHYLSDIIKRPVFDGYILLCQQYHQLLFKTWTDVEHTFSVSELFLLIQSSELKPVQHEDKLTDECSSASEVPRCGVRVRQIRRQTAHTAVAPLMGCLLCRAGTLLRTWHWATGS